MYLIHKYIIENNKIVMKYDFLSFSLKQRDGYCITLRQKNTNYNIHLDGELILH